MVDANNDGAQDIPDTEGIPHKDRPSDEILELATTVVNELGVGTFLTTYGSELYEKLKEAETYAGSAPGNGDVLFMAASLPITNGIIHIASNREKIRAALGVLGESWAVPHTDTISSLSALTLIFLVAEGWRDHKKGPDRKHWLNMIKRIKRWTDDNELDDD